MPIFLRDHWKEWARDWGLAHYPEKGWIHRTEHVVGERKGLLIRVGWGTDQSPGLIACIRFPRVADPGRLCQALIDDATLDTLPGKGSARRKMAVESGAKKTVRIGKPPEFTLTDNALVWRRVFPWSAPKPPHVQSWVDTLIAAVARATPTFDGRCETCATGAVRPYVLVDGLPTFMCATCQQRLKAEGDMADRTYDMIEVRHVPGAALGVAAAFLGAVGWAVVGALTQRIFAAAAIGIGALVAWAYRLGAGRVDAAGRVIAACLTLISVVLGEVLLCTWWVMRAHPGIGFNLDVGWLVYLNVWSKSPGQELITLVFGLVGAWVASKALQRPKLRANVERAGGPGGDERRAA